METMYRQMPELKRLRAAGSDPLYDDDRRKRCERGQGHVLVLRGDRIACLNCPAEWKNEGF